MQDCSNITAILFIYLFYFIFTYFCMTKSRVKFIRPKTIVESFFHMIVLIFLKYSLINLYKSSVQCLFLHQYYFLRSFLWQVDKYCSSMKKRKLSIIRATSQKGSISCKRVMLTGMKRQYIGNGTPYFKLYRSFDHFLYCFSLKAFQMMSGSSIGYLKLL